MASPAAVLDILLVAQTAPANAALAKTQGQLAATSKQAATTGAAMKKAFLGVGVAAAGVGVALFKVGEEFDQAYDKIRTQTGATGKEFGKLQKSFRGVLKTVPTDFDSAADAVAGLNQRLGETGKPLTKLARQITALSEVTGTDVQENVESLTRLFGDWSVKTKDQSDTLDGLFRVSQKTGASVSDLARNMVQFGAPLRNLGFGLDQAAAMFGAFEKTGVNITTVLSGLRLSVGNFAKPTADLAETMDKLNLSAKDTPGAIVEMFKQIKTLKSESEATALAIDAFGKRAGPDLVDTIRGGKFELDALIKTFKSGDGTIRESERTTRDFSEQWELFLNNMKLAIEPAAKDVFKGVADLMKDIRKAFETGGLEGVGDLLADKLAAAIPVVTDAALDVGAKAVEGFVKGFMEAPFLVKAAVGAAVVSRLGLTPQVFGRAGTQAAGGFTQTMVAPGVWQTTGTSAGAKFGGGLKGWAKANGPGIAATLAAIIGPEFARLFQQSLDDLTPPIAEVGIEEFKGADKLEDLRRLIGIIREAGGDITKPMIREWVKAGDVTEKQGGRMIRVITDVHQKAAAEARRTAETQGFGFARALASDGKLLKPELQKILTQLDAMPKKARETAIKTMTDMARFLESTGKLPEGSARKLVKALEDKWGELPKKAKNSGDAASNFLRQSFDDILRDGTKKSKQLSDGVSKNFASMNAAVNSGLKNIGENTNSALKAFGVKPLNFAIVDGKKTGTSGLQKGGVAMVPGYGSGDKVPAMLEPGEVVLNRKAVSAMGGAERANSINRKIPRFAKGGVAGGKDVGDLRSAFDVMGSGPGFVPMMNFLNANTGEGKLVVISGIRPGATVAGTSTTSNHAFGNAVDISTPSIRYLSGTTDQLSQANPREVSIMDATNAYLEKYFAPPIGLDQLWRTAAGGGHWNHIHKGINPKYGQDATAMINLLTGLPGGTSLGGIGGVPREVIKGPDGPLKDLGQKALDKARSAANKYLAKKGGTPQAVAGGTGAVPGGPGQTYTASWYGPTPSTTGYRGDELRGTMSFAELGINGGVGNALGGLPHHKTIGVSLGGKSISVEKLDVGSGGPGLGGNIRAIDIWEDAAKKLPGLISAGLANVQVTGLAEGGVAQKLGSGGIVRDFLEDWRQAEGGKGDQRKALSAAKKQVKKLNVPGMVGSEFGDKLAALEAEAAKFGEYASNAASLTTEDDNGKETQGIFKEHTELDWLGGAFEATGFRGQLQALHEFRNKLAASLRVVAKMRKKVERLVKQAERRLGELRKAIRTGERERRHLEGEIATATENKEQSRKALEAQLAKELKKDRKDQNEDLIASLREGIHSKSTEKQALQDALKKLNKKQTARNALADALAPGSSGLLQTLADQRSTYGEAASTLQTSLDTVQGVGGDIKPMKVLPLLGGIGGDIFTVQQRLHEMGLPRKNTGSTDLTEGQQFTNEYLMQLLREANLRTAVSQAQYGVFQNFAGGFAEGGYIPGGKWGVVGEAGPEVISGPNTITPMGGEGVSVIVNGDIINTPPGMQPVEVRGAKTIVQQGSRGYGRRPLGGAKGY